MVIFLLLTLTFLADSYPICGDCWCSPSDGDMALCPTILEPNMTFSAATISHFNEMVPTDHGESAMVLDCNPYKDASCQTTPPQLHVDSTDAICAFIYPLQTSSCGTYSLKTFENSQDLDSYQSSHADEEEVLVSHLGSCGVCSNTQDLSVFLDSDFTTEGKKCATKAILSEHMGLKCYESLGLTKDCSKIWNYDGIYDAKVCMKDCLSHANLFKDNNGPPPTCTLNPCLQCDEDKAGPLFTQFSGRTRRRSGLISEIIRPCDSIAKNITHSPPKCMA